MSGKDLPKQLGTSYCGPAAFLYCVLEDRPDVYCAYAISLWLRGEYDFRSSAQAVEVDSDEAIRTALSLARAKEPGRSFISDLDWMTMAPLSASTRPGWSRILGSPEPDDMVGSISYPGVVKGWFAAVGARLRADTMGLGLMKTAPASTIKLMAYWANSWIEHLRKPPLGSGEPASASSSEGGKGRADCSALRCLQGSRLEYGAEHVRLGNVVLRGKLGQGVNGPAQ
jgi:hypothetical protein